MVSPQLNETRRFSNLLNEIQAAVEARIKESGVCRLMLTGGNSAAMLYRTWAVRRECMVNVRKRVRIYFGDERCVPPDDAESNFRMVRHNLFDGDIAGEVAIHRMEADCDDLEMAADRYAALLPKAVDVLLLSVGEDGHVASLFPHGAGLYETRRLVLPVTGPKPPFQRLTITPPVIHNARQIFVMALGNRKREVYEEALRDPMNIDELPARLALRGTWLLGD